MKIGKVIGLEKKKMYTSKKTNETYPTITVYISFSDPAVVGVKCDRAWLRCNPDESQYNSYSWLEVGAEVIVNFGGYQGGISDLIPINFKAEDIISVVTGG